MRYLYRSLYCQCTALLMYVFIHTCSPVTAHSLSDALVAAYLNNPDLESARLLLRSTEESLTIARSGYLPIISIAGTAAFANQTESSSPAQNMMFPKYASGTRLVLKQPIFDAKTRYLVKKSIAEINAQREALREAEQMTLYSTAVAFGDVLEKMAAVELSKSSMRFLKARIRAARQGFEVGQGSRTEIAQADTHYQKETMRLHGSTAALIASKARLQQMTGIKAEDLTSVLSLEKILPTSLEDSLESAMENNPSVVKAMYSLEVLKQVVNAQDSSWIPSVGLEGSAGYVRDDLWFLPNNETSTVGTASIGITVMLPLYAGGRISAEKRKTRALLESARSQLISKRNTVQQQVISSWSALKAAKASFSAAKAAISSAEIALDSVMKEHSVGQRSLLEVLDARSRFENAHANLAAAKQRHLVASFALAMGTGCLSLSNLGIEITPSLLQKN